MAFQIRLIKSQCIELPFEVFIINVKQNLGCGLPFDTVMIHQPSTFVFVKKTMNKNDQE